MNAMRQYVDGIVGLMYYVQEEPEGESDPLDRLWYDMNQADRDKVDGLIDQIRLLTYGSYTVDRVGLLKELISMDCHEAVKLVKSISPIAVPLTPTREITLTRYRADCILSSSPQKTKNYLITNKIVVMEGKFPRFTSFGMRVYAELNRRGSLPARDVFITVRLVDEDTLAASLDDTLRVSVVGPNEVAFFWGRAEMVRWKTWSEEPVQDCARALCTGALRFPFEMFSSEVQAQWPALALAVAEYVEKMPLLPGPRKDFLVKFAEGVRASSPQASLPVGGVA